MSARTTPTGVPFIDCTTCGVEHPATRGHCTRCNAPSLFIAATGYSAGLCLPCGREQRGPYRADLARIPARTTEERTAYRAMRARLEYAGLTHTSLTEED